jgi:RNA polymerase sigma factor (sigma-70 family)
MPRIRTAATSSPREDFEALFTTYYWPVRDFVLRRAPAAEVDDLVAETFLVAWRRFADIGKDPLPWLLGVARRSVANQLRAERRRGALAGRLENLCSVSVQAWEAPGEMDAELAQALRALSEREREALLLVRLARANPVPPAAHRGTTERDRAQAILRRVLIGPGAPARREPVPSPVVSRLAAVAVLVAAAAALVIFAFTGGHSPATERPVPGAGAAVSSGHHRATGPPRAVSPHLSPRAHRRRPRAAPVPSTTAPASSYEAQGGPSSTTTAPRRQHRGASSVPPSAPPGTTVSAGPSQPAPPRPNHHYREHPRR